MLSPAAVPSWARVVVLVAVAPPILLLFFRHRRRRAVQELAYLRGLSFAFDLPGYVELLAQGHPERARVRVVVWFESAPPPEARSAWEARAREADVVDVEWEQADEQIRLTSDFVGLRSHGEGGDWSPSNGPIHSQTRHRQA